MTRLRCEHGSAGGPRLLVIGGGAAVAWGLVAAVGGCGRRLAGPALGFVSGGPDRVGCGGGPGGHGPGCGPDMALATAAHAAAIARRFDRAAGSGGASSPGWNSRVSRRRGAGMSRPFRRAPAPTWRRMAVDQAAALAARGAGGQGGAGQTPGAIAGELRRSVAGDRPAGPAHARAGRRPSGSRFTSPLADVPPFSSTEFEVTPGNAQRDLRRGAWHPGRHQRHAGRPVELVLEDQGGRQTVLPMFPEREGVWQTVLAKVTEPSVLLCPRLPRPQRAIPDRRDHRAADRERRGCGSCRRPTPIRRSTRGPCPRTACRIAGHDRDALAATATGRSAAARCSERRQARQRA